MRVWQTNTEGRRIGQDHPRARYSDGEVAMVWLLRDAGWGYRRIAQKLEMPRSTVRAIVQGCMRCQAVGGHKPKPPGA